MTSLPAAEPHEIGLSRARLDRLSEVLARRCEQGHIPGAVAIVVRDGRIGYCESFGLRDPARREPMRSDAIFRIYSMSKPIVSVAAMMLWEAGALLLNDPVAKFIPAFADQKLLVERAGRTEFVAPESQATIQDLLRHTAGLTYDFRGTGAVHRAYADARLRACGSSEEQAAAIARLPLAHQPGTRWDYSHATDVLGRVVEVAAGERLGAFLERRILAPLGMTDTAFWVPEAKHARLAEAFAKDPETGADVVTLPVRQRRGLESGGGGLVGTALDYARFLQMLANGGELGGVRLLGRKTVELMTADHLGDMPRTTDLVPPGYGFGLGFAVRVAAGLAAMPGSVGQYWWAGAAGTDFFVDPAERLHAVLMIQAPGQREHYRYLFRTMVYAAVAD
jgi:CubicO group peptidase (beta-lactamase class C family)